jgi:dihydrofolate reductase
MSKVKLDISVSLDGYAAGPNQSLDEPLGAGGEALHEWAFANAAWREAHGREGGERGAEADLVAASVAATGASIMGRRMYSSGSGPWDEDPKASGWWGDEPPFHHPVFVLTHHDREPLEMQGGTTFHFVTDGIEAALERAREAAADGEVHIAGGAQTAQQYLNADLVDELTLHIAPIMLGAGERLFEGVKPLELEPVLSLSGPIATHVRYAVRHA